MDNSCAFIFQALSDPTRQKILTLLTKEEMCVTEIGRHFQMTQPSISHHLDILKHAGLVVFQKKGKEVFYRANCCVCVPGCCQDFLGKLGLVIKCKKA